MIERRLHRLMLQNPLRTDFQRHYENIVAEYNREKDRATIETELPVEKYDEPEVQERAEEVYHYVYRVYLEIPSPFYSAGAVA